MNINVYITYINTFVTNGRDLYKLFYISRFTHELILLIRKLSLVILIQHHGKRAHFIRLN